MRIIDRVINSASVRIRRATLPIYRPMEFVNGILAALGVPPLTAAQRENFFAEITNHAVLTSHYAHCHRTVKRLGMVGRSEEEYKNLWQTQRFRKRTSIASRDIVYVLIRALRPTLIVETGVAGGLNAATFLAALEANQHGRLHSIDLPPVQGRGGMWWTADENSPVGVLVPESLKGRWTLTAGDATYELPRLFADTTIDIFMHDSDHSRAHMLYEFAFADKHLKRPGLLISDDILENDAFFAYFGRRNTFVHCDNPNIGVAVIC